MGFNFSEEEITSMYKMYQDCLNEIQEETKNVAEALTVHARELKYEPVIKLSIEVVKYYNEELKQAELRAMDEWKNGDLSFTRVMEMMSAGENAKNRSRQLESQIEQEIQSWKRLDDTSLSGINSTNWKCEVSDFESIKQEINRYVETLEAKQTQYTNNIENQKSENEIYVSIEPVVIQSISIVIAGFKSGISESFSSLAQEFEEKSNEVRGLSADAAQTIAEKSQNFVSSGASALKAKVKQILD
ncbi:MAG: hypothetical protein Q4D76_17495 [Oscillospiraceae bacterium]|nr:hypothetical protein [Oscillospiraceae bacterium]